MTQPKRGCTFICVSGVLENYRTSEKYKISNVLDSLGSRDPYLCVDFYTSKYVSICLQKDKVRFPLELLPRVEKKYMAVNKI